MPKPPLGVPVRQPVQDPRVAIELAILRTDCGLTGSGVDDDLGTEAKSTTVNSGKAAMPLIIGGVLDKIAYLVVLVVAILVAGTSIYGVSKDMSTYITESKVEIVEIGGNANFPQAQFCITLDDPKWTVDYVDIPSNWIFTAAGGIDDYDWTTIDVTGVRAPGITDLGDVDIVQYSGTMEFDKGTNFIEIPATITREVIYCDPEDPTCFGLPYGHADASPDWGWLAGEKVCLHVEAGKFQPTSTKDYLNPFFDVMATCDGNAGFPPLDDSYYYGDGPASLMKQCVKDLVITDKPGDKEWDDVGEPVDQGKNLTAEIANEDFVGVPYLLGTIDLNNQGPEYVDVHTPLTTGRMTLTKLSHTDKDGKTTTTDAWSATYSALDPYGKGQKFVGVDNTRSPSGFDLYYFDDKGVISEVYHPGYTMKFFNPDTLVFRETIPLGYSHGPAQTSWINFDAYLNLQSTMVFSTSTKEVVKATTDDLGTAIGAASAIVGLIIGIFFKPVVGFFIKDTNTGLNRQGVKGMWRSSNFVRDFKLENIKGQEELLLARTERTESV